jgi:hypothetical protein
MRVVGFQGGQKQEVGEIYCRTTPSHLGCLKEDHSQSLFNEKKKAGPVTLQSCQIKRARMSSRSYRLFAHAGIA